MMGVGIERGSMDRTEHVQFPAQFLANSMGWTNSNFPLPAPRPHLARQKSHPSHVLRFAIVQLCIPTTTDESSGGNP